MDSQQPPNFKAIHKRAAELVKNDPVFAYAVAKEIRKSVVGKNSENIKLQMLSRIMADGWNTLSDLTQHHQNSPQYSEAVVAIAADHLIVIFDILTDKFPNDYSHTGTRK